jgi:hypothetical protein
LKVFPSQDPRRNRDMREASFWLLETIRPNSRLRQVRILQVPLS